MSIVNEDASSLPTETCDKLCNLFSFTEVRSNTMLRHEWSESMISEFGVNLLYQPKLHSSIAANAEWLDLPPRRQLVERYRKLKSIDPKSLQYSQVEEIEDLEIMLNTLRFHAGTGLGEIHEWIRRFVFHKNDCFWYRLKVQAGCMKSFVDNLVEEKLSIVMLPYGCVTESWVEYHFVIEEKELLQKTHRDMLFVIKGTENDKFIDALDRVKYPGTYIKGKYYHKNIWYQILDAEFFVRSIASMCTVWQTDFNHRRNVIFNPVVPHAFWWLCLMVPMNSFTESSFKNIFVNSEIKNCVVLFDPQNLCIGESIRNLENYICENEQPFVHWFKNEKLSMKRIQHFESKDFVEWCISNRKNTLLNLNDINLEETTNGKIYITCTKSMMNPFSVNTSSNFGIES